MRTRLSMIVACSLALPSPLMAQESAPIPESSATEVIPEPVPVVETPTISTAQQVDYQRLELIVNSYYQVRGEEPTPTIVARGLELCRQLLGLGYSVDDIRLGILRMVGQVQEAKTLPLEALLPLYIEHEVPPTAVPAPNSESDEASARTPVEPSALEPQATEQGSPSSPAAAALLNGPAQVPPPPTAEELAEQEEIRAQQRKMASLRRLSSTRRKIFAAGFTTFLTSRIVVLGASIGMTVGNGESGERVALAFIPIGGQIVMNAAYDRAGGVSAYSSAAAFWSVFFDLSGLVAMVAALDPSPPFRAKAAANRPAVIPQVSLAPGHLGLRWRF